MIPLLAMIIIPIYSPDAYVMCGPEPLEECLIKADQCLSQSAKLGYDIDEAWEFCVEQLDPSLIHFR